MSDDGLTSEERRQVVLRRLDDLHAQVKRLVESKHLPVLERSQKVSELNKEYLREAKRLNG